MLRCNTQGADTIITVPVVTEEDMLVVAVRNASIKEDRVVTTTLARRIKRLKPSRVMVELDHRYVFGITFCSYAL